MSFDEQPRLFWSGREAPAPGPPGLLVEDVHLSRRDPAAAGHDDNRLIHGDNLSALLALEAEFAGRIRCIYIDPPYNTGQVLRHYHDGLESSQWLTLLHERLVVLRRLLSTDGAVFAQIDDSESSYLQVLMDEVFGRRNRIPSIVVRRSAATGHKAINPGPVPVTDFIHVYARDRPRWRWHALSVARSDHDRAYATRLVNPADPPSRWAFEPLGKHVARVLGYASTREARQALGRSEFDRRCATFALDHADEVIRFAQPNYPKVSQAARDLIDASRLNVGEVLRLAREGRPDMYFRKGNRILFLRDKVGGTESGRTLVEPLTNWWNDIPWQGIAREGGVEFPKGKKPEKLLGRILDLATDPGDWVLDAYAGSGTTGAVAHKMGRRWILIEQGEHCLTHIVPRLRRVVEGNDPTGVTTATGWAGGGGFRFLRIEPSPNAPPDAPGVAPA